MLIGGGVPVFLDVQDCSGDVKSKEYIAACVIDRIENLQDPRSVVQVRSP